MLVDYQNLEFEYHPPSDLSAGIVNHYPVVVVGAGPVGLSAAIDLAQQGVSVVLLDDDNTLSSGSRAICFAKRTLEIWDRLGCGERAVDKGVSWNTGRVFFQEGEIYSFNLLAEEGHHRPAFINLQQYYAEAYLSERAAELDNIDLRWKNKVVGIEQSDTDALITIDTPDGQYQLRCDYVVAADGSRSAMRAMMGLESKGRVFQDRFLIADIKMKANFPVERWFWFDPPFHRNQSTLLHSQPDDVWRIDFQLGWDADPVAEKDPARIIPRVKALLGNDVEFELEWASVYTFACLRMEKFRHGRVLFAGDSAHGVSPFGARGANSGVQDAENLAWKIRLVHQGQAADKLLDTYSEERVYAADENILNSTRSTDFLTPKSDISKIFRDEVLKLSRDYAFARTLVNSGRLSVPAVLRTSALNTEDVDEFEGNMEPGAACADAPITVDGGEDWFLNHVGNHFVLLVFSEESVPEKLINWVQSKNIIKAVQVVTDGSAEQDRAGTKTVVDTKGLLTQRYDAQAGTCYLIRPDQHVCARWRSASVDRLKAALNTATCREA